MTSCASIHAAKAGIAPCGSLTTMRRASKLAPSIARDPAAVHSSRCLPGSAPKNGGPMTSDGNSCSAPGRRALQPLPPRLRPEEWRTDDERRKLVLRSRRQSVAVEHDGVQNVRAERDLGGPREVAVLLAGVSAVHDARAPHFAVRGVFGAHGARAHAPRGLERGDAAERREPRPERERARLNA